MVLPDPNNRAHSDWDTRVAAWSSVANAFAPGMFPVLVIDRTHPQTRTASAGSAKLSADITGGVRATSMRRPDENLSRLQR